jgi:YHS domain-containing protein
MPPATTASPVGETPVATKETARPPVGMDGYCPVTLLRKNSWTKGDPRYGVIHRGHLYLFAGPEEKEVFFADPDQYSPVLSGIDPVRLAEAGEAILGERAHGVVYRKRVYLFSSEANLERFWEEPERFASPIRQAMEQGDVGRLFR